MDHCGTWTSSYRLVLGLLEEIDVQPRFESRELVWQGETPHAEAAEEAIWDVVLARLAAIQEYGWHAGLDPLMWASDSLNGSLTDLNWPRLQAELATHREVWIELIITSAKQHHEFFRPQDTDAQVSQEVEG